jgi:type I restriction enzyme S subunit
MSLLNILANEVVSKNLKMLDKEDFAIMIRTTNLAANDFTNNIKYITAETYNFFKKSKIYGGEIIMNKIGSAGDFWIMPILNKPVSLGLNQFVIRLKNFNTKFLFFYLSTPYGKQIIKSSLNGAVTKSITKSAVKNIPVLHPNLEIQNEFSEIIELIENQKAKLLANSNHSESLFSSLLQEAFG